MSVGGTGAVTVDGRRLSYRRAGTDGPPVVLLHGGGVDDATLSWRYVLADLADDHRVYALDWPGYGDSDDRGYTHASASHVRTLERFLDAVGLNERANGLTVAGISMGGAAALGFALEQPDRVSKLALVDSYGLGSEIPAGSLWRTLAHVPGANALGWATLGTSREATRIGLGNVVANVDALSSSFVDDVYERARRPGAGRAFEAFQRNELAADGSALTDYSDDLEALETPTLLVHGRDDRLFPARWSERAAERLANARLEIIDDCGHWPPRECPERFSSVFNAFLEAD
ncbi:alpha/beta fold hydrolase [Natronobiforma cellulositropha]|uniref:alpha/beta fold hydrolase n=1 Tax=Natronobiforma cellulositropha TaxID=1679076 RepID=UPI0021D5A666|nr:alpha/beta fold hydrolase [Natronobiforma cellulositropha]